MRGKRRIIYQDEMNMLHFPEVEFSPEERAEAERNGGVLRDMRTVTVNGRSGRAGPLTAWLLAMAEVIPPPLDRREVERLVAQCEAWIAERGTDHEPMSQGWFVARLRQVGRRYLETAEPHLLAEMGQHSEIWKTRQAHFDEIRSKRQRAEKERVGLANVNADRRDRAAERMALVLPLAARGFSAESIRRELAKQGEPFSLRSIQRDLQKIRGG